MTTDIDWNLPPIDSAHTVEQHGLPTVILPTASSLDLDMAKRHLAPIIESVESLVEEAKALAVRDETSCSLAVQLGTTMQKLLKIIDRKRKEILLGPMDFVDSVNAFSKMFTARLQDGVAIAKQKVDDYQAIAEQKRREDEMAARAEAERLQHLLNQEAAARGIEPVLVPTPVIPTTPAPIRTESGSASMRKVWTFEIEDLAQVPPEYLTLNEKLVRQAISGGIRQIRGLRIFQMKKAVFRT
ncbi:MAG TPA: hypothetical protein PKM59_06140 [Thermodesulfobacteriota bacterium]|nr:hypothetical protein [Thermodesulfobacteriota bacterium]HNU71842.1 hypothetical protein [Thermodesulfobacteriota bacterium]